MDENTREQLLNVLFYENEPLNESEELEEGFIQNVGNTIKTKAAQAVNNAKANIGAQLRGAVPALTAQAKAKRAAAVQNIKTTAQTKNAQLDANLKSQKAAGKFQKDAMKAVKTSAKQAAAQYKSLSQTYSDAKKADTAFAAAKPNDVKSIIDGICAAFCGLQIYGDKADSEDMKDMAKNTKQNTKDAKKANKQNIKNAGKALQDVADGQAAAANAEATKSNEALGESVQWEAYKMFNIRENAAGQFAKQGVINILSNFIAFNNADPQSKLPNGSGTIGDNLVNAILQAKANLMGDGKGGANYLNTLNTARTGNGGPVVYKNVKNLYTVLKGLNQETLTKAVSALAQKNGADPEATEQAPVVDTGDPKTTEALNNAIQGLNPKQLQAFIAAANKLQIPKQ